MDSIKFLSFEEAKNFVRWSGIRTKADYDRWTGSFLWPKDMPINPAEAYKNCGWKGWNDFLGITDSVWEGWNDFLGNEPPMKRYRSLEDAKIYVQSMGIRTKEEYRKWAATSERPEDIPANPEEVYGGNGVLDPEVEKVKGWPDCQECGKLLMWVHWNDIERWYCNNKECVEYEMEVKDVHLPNCVIIDGKLYAKRPW